MDLNSNDQVNFPKLWHRLIHAESNLKLTQACEEVTELVEKPIPIVRSVDDVQIRVIAGGGPGAWLEAVTIVGWWASAPASSEVETSWPRPVCSRA